MDILQASKVQFLGETSIQVKLRMLCFFISVEKLYFPTVSKSALKIGKKKDQICRYDYCQLLEDPSGLF